MIELKNLDFRIVGSQEAGYTVEASGPSGERASAASNWAAVAELDADLAAIRTGSADHTQLERIGGALFQALFPMPVMRVYFAVQARLEEDEGLRLRLHLPPEIAHLPWELLYYPPDYLTINPLSPVVRFLDLPDTPRPLATEPPLRLLHLIASPVDAPRLDAERESAQLRAALAELSDQVEITLAESGTLAALHAELRRDHHVLHFSGHGGLANGEGYLLFEDEQGQGETVNGDTLAQLLRGTDIRLAILNACESAQGTAADAFGSVAATLVRARLPAVIAHQYPMPDHSATTFATGFYQALVDGYPVDAAVSEGRKAIVVSASSSWRDSVDWATPVLFMRAPDGHILTFEKKPRRASSSEAGYVTTVDTLSGTLNIGPTRYESAPQRHQTSPEESPDDTGYNLAEIRKLLTAAFTPQDLRRFCQDRPIFRPTVSRFGRGQSLDGMVAEVIDFCESKFLWPEFLAAVEADNPKQYKRYEPRLFSTLPADHPDGVVTPQLFVDPLANLLNELRDTVRDLAPEAKRAQALEKTATLRGAVSERRPNLALMESVWQWFDGELPALSGTVLSTILAVKPKLEELGDDYLLLDFRQRFEEPF